MLLENVNEQETIIEKEDIQEEEEMVIAPKKKKSKPQKKENTLEEMIDVWKAQYKRIFKNEIDGETIIWRRLKRGEYKQILALEEDDEDTKILTKQDMMVKTAILYPYNVDELIEDNAGLATVLSEEILAKSGFAISYTEEL